MKKIFASLLLLTICACSVFADAGFYTNVQQAMTTDAQVKAIPGQYYGSKIYNPNASAVWVEYYNTTTAPTIGSTTNLLIEFAVPATSSVMTTDDNGVAFSSGLYVAVATTATGSTAPGTGLTITTVYR